MTDNKICTDCKIIKKLDKFQDRKTGRFGKNSQCKDCHNTDQRIKFSNFEARIKRSTYYKKRYAAMPEMREQTALNNWKNRYGITDQEFADMKKNEKLKSMRAKHD